MLFMTLFTLKLEMEENILQSIKNKSFATRNIAEKRELCKQSSCMLAMPFYDFSVCTTSLAFLYSLFSVAVFFNPFTAA